MKTRFTPLVKLKHNKMQKSQRVVQQSNKDLQNAKTALESSYSTLQSIEPPSQGSMSDFLATRSLLTSQRGHIQHNKEWINFAQNQLIDAKEKLKQDMIEHEKFKYLEFQEIEQRLKAIAKQEAKDMDEIALMTFSKKGK